MSNGSYGDTTRGLRRAWTRRLGPVEDRANWDELQALFHEVGLFPSKAQVFEMVQCARECGSRRRKKCYRLSSNSSASGVTSAENDGCNRSSSSSNHSDGRRAAPAVDDEAENNLTFGEFAFFAAELIKYYGQHQVRDKGWRQQHQQQQQDQQHQTDSVFVAAGDPVQPAPAPSSSSQLRTQKSSTSAYDVFLGGSCGPTTWRADAAIPFLKSQGITYYNPQQSNWVPEMIELEHQAKQTSQVLFFVLDEKTRNVVSMVEVSYLSGAGRRLIVVLSSYPTSAPHSICGEEISVTECTDLNGAMTTVHDLVERGGTPVFASMTTALGCTRKVLREGVAVEELSLEDGAVPIRLAHVQLGDKLVRAREAFDTLDTARAGKITLGDIRMAFRIHANGALSPGDLREILSAHDVDVAAAVATDKGRSSGSINGLPLDRVLIDFDHFCCILAEFKNRTKSVSGRGASGGSSERTATRRGKAASALRRKVLAPFTRLSRWVSSGGADGVQLRQRSSRPGQGASAASCATPQPPPPPSVLLSRRGSQVRDVYLGGTSRGCDRWRDQVAIPALKKHGLTYHDSRVARVSRSGRLIPLEAAAMDNSRCLLFVIQGESRSVSAMCEAAYHVGRRGREASQTVVLCVQKVPEDAGLDGPGQKLSKMAWKDYNRGRTYLSDIANREGVPVFEEVSEAIDCILQRCKSVKSLNK